MSRLNILTLVSVIAALPDFAVAHDHTRSKYLAALEAKNAGKASPRLHATDELSRLTITVVDAETERLLSASVRITSLPDQQPWQPGDVKTSVALWRRDDWYSVAPGTTLTVPRTELEVEAFRGLGWHRAKARMDLEGKARGEIMIPMKRFHDPQSRGWHSGNTHFHLKDVSKGYADRYLKVVPDADEVDLLFVSHLEQVDYDKTYTTNQYDKRSLEAISTDAIWYGYGEEHRHNFAPFGDGWTRNEGYGHVMLLDIDELVEPVSIGPRFNKTGTDGIPLRRGIDRARDMGATVVWCHSSYGVEDIPNWVSGRLHAQNIFDNDTHDEHFHYEETFYRYLDIGLKVPFSTGTDWFMHDQTMAYAKLDGAMTPENWLAAMRAGRTFVTNGPFLELEAGGHQIGDTIKPDAPGRLPVRGRGLGRNDFLGLELVYNGKIVYSTRTREKDDVYVSSLTFSLELDEPGWLALRIPWTNNRNDLGARMRAHTSPIYVEIAGKKRFNRNAARGLIQEMRDSIDFIETKGTFADDNELSDVLAVYLEGIRILEHRLQVDSH